MTVVLGPWSGDPRIGLENPGLGPVWGLSEDPRSGDPQSGEPVSTEPQTSVTVVWPVLETLGLGTPGYSCILADLL